MRDGGRGSAGTVLGMAKGRGSGRLEDDDDRGRCEVVVVVALGEEERDQGLLALRGLWPTR